LIDQIISEDVGNISKSFNPAFFKDKRVLVTGGSGFLGSYLCDALVNLGSYVTCLDNFASGTLSNIDHLSSAKNFNLSRSDVSETGLKEDFDYIFHFASRASPGDYQVHPVETLRANSLGSYRVLDLARKSNSRTIFASTSEAYGDSKVIPTPEDYWGNVNPVGVRSSYDEGKRFGEALFMAYHREYGLDTRIVRIHNTYGPRIRADGCYARAIPRFISQATRGEDITVYGDGSQTRSFCYVSDTIRGVLSVFCNDGAEGDVFNIGSPHDISILELAEIVKALVGSGSRISFSPLPEDDPRQRKPSIEKAERMLGWRPQVSLEEGLQRTIDWFRTQKIQ
jgi:UDP-glucuronate decarboxylase